MTTTGMTGTSTQENSYSATNTYHLIHVALLEEHQRLDNVNKPDKFISWKVFSEIHIICDKQRILVANEEDIQWKSIPGPFHFYVYVRCQSVYGTDHK
ncbi:hypothetical protein T12_16707 [Trichinella patagoniensis]|uniref:Uncharacterized protein n=1 Tax=Trichinella patagoniensis TaxID=990121 RepID=A0A0V0ZVY2_9BILA|nr:hypothetical protein T12_16707 [Trichinella patagoniensis]